LNSGVKIEVGWKFSFVNARGIAGQRAVRVRGGQSDILLGIYIPYFKTFESPEHCITSVCNEWKLMDRNPMAMQLEL